MPLSATLTSICGLTRSSVTCVLQAFEEQALTPQAIEQVLRLSERDVADQQAKLAREGKDVDKRIARLVAAIETGGDAPSRIAERRELEARRQSINVEARTRIQFRGWS